MTIDFKFRASAIGQIMSDAISIDPALLTPELATISRKKTKTDEEKALLAPLKERSLSAGAKTYLNTLAKEFVYGYEKKVSSKYLEKGLMVEQDSIDLYNSVFFTSHAKNTERRSNEWVTGEADIVAPDEIIDIKSSWSLDTFPAHAAMGIDTDYEWQGRTYMWLWDKPSFKVAYCLVNTPDELVGYEDPEIHYVDHIDPVMRVTRVHYARDFALEERMRVKVIEARKYIDLIVHQIAKEHAA